MRRFEAKGPWSLLPMLVLLIELRSVNGMERFRLEQEVMVIRCCCGEVWWTDESEAMVIRREEVKSNSLGPKSEGFQRIKEHY